MHEAEFLDVRPTLAYILKSSRTDPWFKDEVQTIIGSSRLVMRRRDAANVPRVRLLHGVELLAFMGWGRVDWACRTACSHSTLVSLAGNAYSAFAVGPVLAALLPFVFAEADASHESRQCLSRASKASSSDDECD